MKALLIIGLFLATSAEPLIFKALGLFLISIAVLNLTEDDILRGP